MNAEMMEYLIARILVNQGHIMAAVSMLVHKRSAKQLREMAEDSLNIAKSLINDNESEGVSDGQ